ncbi:hypothetical protein C8R44DRAFT_990739 [Mycena epipterygia]|nr:hypothetical protein C8R44DRAFT_990739 [Mycena epipterygia]
MGTPALLTRLDLDTVLWRTPASMRTATALLGALERDGNYLLTVQRQLDEHSPPSPALALFTAHSPCWAHSLPRLESLRLWGSPSALDIFGDALALRVVDCGGEPDAVMAFTRLPVAQLSVRCDELAPTADFTLIYLVEDLEDVETKMLLPLASGMGSFGITVADGFSASNAGLSIFKITGCLTLPGLEEFELDSISHARPPLATPPLSRGKLVGVLWELGALEVLAISDYVTLEHARDSYGKGGGREHARRRERREGRQKPLVPRLSAIELGSPMRFDDAVLLAFRESRIPPGLRAFTLADSTPFFHAVDSTSYPREVESTPFHHADTPTPYSRAFDADTMRAFNPALGAAVADPTRAFNHAREPVPGARGFGDFDGAAVDFTLAAADPARDFNLTGEDKTAFPAPRALNPYWLPSPPAPPSAAFSALPSHSAPPTFNAGAEKTSNTDPPAPFHADLYALPAHSCPLNAWSISPPASMPPSCLPVQELWHHILDLTSPETLPSCSIVCGSFVACAQSYILRAIYIGGSHHASRLFSTLSFSLHLVPYIRSLDIGSCGAEILEILAPTAWSHLGMLLLQHSYGREASDLDRIYGLVGFPSLRNLHTGTESLDLSLLPALTFLDCDGILSLFLETFASLPASNTVREMHVRILEGTTASSICSSSRSR